MTELGIEYITILLFAGLLLTIFLGVPLTFALGTVSLVAFTSSGGRQVCS